MDDFVSPVSSSALETTFPSVWLRGPKYVHQQQLLANCISASWVPVPVGPQTETSSRNSLSWPKAAVLTALKKKEKKKREVQTASFTISADSWKW